MRGSVYLDTNVFIKAFEADDAEARQAWSVLEALGTGAFRGVTSELTLAEVLPKPFATAADKLAAAYEATLRTGISLGVIPITRDILIASSRLRAVTPQMRLPDALHVATALHEGCAVFLSGDLRIRSFGNLSIIRLTPTTLDDLRRLTA